MSGFRIIDILPIPEQYTDLAEGLYDVLQDVALTALAVEFGSISATAGETDDLQGDELDESDIEGAGTDYDDDFAETASMEVSEETVETIEVTERVSLTPTITFSCNVPDEISFSLPWLNAGSFVIDAGDYDIALTLDPDDFEVSLAASLLYRFSQDVLAPVKTDDGITYEADETREAVEIELASVQVALSTAGLSIATDTGITLASPAMIGTSGVVIESASISLNLDGEGERPTGTPETWKGLYIDEASIRFSNLFDGSVQISGLGIGSGGISGSIAANADLTYNESGEVFEGDLAGTIAGVAGGISSISVELQQNIPVSGGISGQIALPLLGTTEVIDIAVSLDMQGNFALALSGEVDITLAPLGTLTLTGLAFATDNGTSFIEISGSLAFDGSAVSSYDLPTISVDGLRIDEHGKVSLPAGGLSVEVKKTITLFGVFQMEVDALSFGTEEYGGADYTYVGFSGGIKLCDGLPMGISTKGLQILWRGSDVRVLCSGVGVNFEIPDVLTFAGEVELDSDLERFTGAITLNLISLDMVIDGTLIIDKQHGDGVIAPADYTAFYVELDVQLPAGIPLGSTGLAIYGFSGMFARHMIPEQTDYDGDGEFHWFNDWYRPDAAASDQMPWTADPPEDCYGAVGFGVGTTFGTLADNGFTFASKLALVFSFPGPVIMLIGRGNILRERSKLVESTIFDTMIVFDGNEKSVLAALAMSYEIPASSSASDGTDNTGWILDASANSEAFFDFDDPENWHVYMGQSEESKRIRATILKLFSANSYLMLDNSSMAAGMSVGMDKSYSFGPAEVSLVAKLWGDGLVTWAPQYLEADAGFLGEVIVAVFTFDFGLSAEATIQLTTPTPYYLGVKLTVSISLPWPFDDLSFTIEMEWEESLQPAPVTPLLAAVSVNDYKTSTVWSLDLTTNAHTGTSIDSSLFTNTVELDARPLVSFARNVMDDAGFGTPRPTTQKETVSGETFEYRLQDLQLNQWEWDDEVQTSGHWERIPDVTSSWQATGGGNGTQLELYGDGPFSYLSNTITGSSSGAAPESAGVGTPYADTYLAINTAYPVDLSPLSVNYNEYANNTALTLHADMTYDSWYERSARMGYVLITKKNKGADSCISFANNVDLSVLITPTKAINLLSLDCKAASPSSRLDVEIVTTSGATLRTTLAVSTRRRQIEMPPGFDHISHLTLIGKNAYVYGFTYVNSETVDDALVLGDSTASLAEPRTTLDPNSYYQVVVTTNEDTNMTDKTQYAYFKTSSPPADLTPYIETVYSTTIPLFTGYDFTLVGNENYLEEMYGESITVKIYDENNEELTDETGVAVSYTAYWNNSLAYNYPYYIYLWINTYVSSGVSTASESDIAANDNLYAKLSAGTGLPPGRTLTARVYSSSVSDPGTPIYSFVFSTGQYENFVDLCADFSAYVYETSANGTLAWDDLLTTAETFDTIWYDAAYLGQTGTLATPSRPEITRISQSGSTRGLLVSFPTPIESARLSFSLTSGSGTAYDLTTFARSDDAQYLLVPTLSGRTTALVAGTYTLGMTYTLDNGSTTLIPLRYGGVTTSESGEVTFIIE